MGNIIYAVAGEGYGHATRSKPIIDFLRRHHNVNVVAGGKALMYLRRFFPVSLIASTYLVYRNNSVSTCLTFLLNLIRAPLYLLSFLKMLCIMVMRSPDALVTDFEEWSTYAALLTGVPIVSVDNENIITNAKIDLPKHHRWNFAKAWIVTKCIIPFAHAIVIPSYFFPPLSNDRAMYINPIIRKEIARRKLTHGEHVLVSQTSSTNKQLLTVLKQFQRQHFVIYGFPREGKDGNLHFKRFDEQGYFDDLASAKAVIANGGFSLLSESLFLRKPVLSIPVTGQCEQIMNAHALERLGYGMIAHQASVAVLKKFFARLSTYREALKVLPRWDSSQELRKIEGVLKRVTA